MATTGRTLDIGQIEFYIENVPFNSRVNDLFAKAIVNDLEHRLIKEGYGYPVNFHLEGFSKGCTKIRFKVTIQDIAAMYTIYILITNVTNAIASLPDNFPFANQTVENITEEIDDTYANIKKMINDIRDEYKIYSKAHIDNEIIVVKRGNTMSAIASILSHLGYTKEQRMIAIYERNRDAFYKPNINCLSTGATLVIPSPYFISKIPKIGAENIVKKHYKEYRKLKMISKGRKK